MKNAELSAAGVSHCGHRPPCVECSKYAAPIPQQPAPGIPTLEQIRAAIEDNLTCMYACTRVWEAWHVGTMSQEDFIHASETEFAEDTANAIHALFAVGPIPQQPATEPDMFWNHDDPERPYSSIDEFLNHEICNGTPLEVGDTRTIQRAIRLTNIEIRITAVHDEECEADYEVIAAAPQPKETK